MELDVQRTPRGRKRLRTVEHLGNIPNASGEHALDPDTVIRTQFSRENGHGRKVFIQMEGEMIHKKGLTQLQEGVAVLIKPDGLGKVNLSRTKTLHVKM